MADRNDQESDVHASTATFEYIKSEFFRVVHADGAIGAITPRGLIHFSFFTERPAIPKKMVYSLKKNGTLGDEIESERVVRDGFIREMDVDVIMSFEVAEKFVNWLNQKIAEAKIVQAAKQEIQLAQLTEKT